jgi:hypothetical protein
MFIYQLFLISVGILVPLTGLSFIAWPFLIAYLVLMKKDFRRMAGMIVIMGALYLILIVVGQAIGQ